MEIAFMGEIQKAKCKCHHGQFVVGVFLVTPNGDQIFVGSELFESEKKAEKKMPKLVEKLAKEVLKKMGLARDKARSVRVSEDPGFLDEYLKRNATTIH